MKTKIARFASPFVGSCLLMLGLLATPVASSAQAYVSVAIAPPALPVYVQPVLPGPGYIWAPGYWGYGAVGYYWVPGTWVLAPYVGALWTPGYWGWGNGAYFWHGGYWGPHVGYYGGINYGFGYVGVGYHGGSWNGGVFNYNTAVTNVNVTNIHNTYNTPVAQNTSVSRVSYNGGAGGITAQPTAEERLAENDRHTPATQLQTRHEQLASTNRAQFASVNHGNPSLAATPRAATFKQANTNPTSGTHAQNTGQPHITQSRTQYAPQGQPHITQSRTQYAPQGQPHPQGQPSPQGQSYPQGQQHSQGQQHASQPAAHHEEGRH